MSVDESSGAGGLREMSTDEMNAMRAKLGLKPLDPSPPTAASSADPEDDSNLSTMDRLRIAKERRMDRERARTRRTDDVESKPAFTLGDESEDAGSTASWVEKHKKVMEEKKRAAAKAKQLEEDEQEQIEAPIDVEGLRVVHDLDQLGEDSVLIIKDTHVLDNEDGDELENVELVSVEKGKRYQDKIKKKSKYDVYDEDGNSKGVLSHYDEEEDEKKAQKSKGFTLGKGGSYKTASGDAKKSTDATAKTVAMVLEGAEQGEYGETFQFGSGPKLSSDFEQANDDEEVTFSKKASIGNAKKPKKIRKKKIEEAIDSEQPDDGGSLLDSLAPVSTGRLLSRNDRSRLVTEEDDRAAELRQRNLAKYQNALTSASERSQAVFATGSAPKSRFEEIAQRTRELAAKREQEALQAQQETNADAGVVYSSLTDFAFRYEAPEIKKEDPAPYYTQPSAYGEASMDIDDAEREEAPVLQRAPVSQPPASREHPAPVKVKSETEELPAPSSNAADDEDEESRVQEAAARLRKSRGRKATGLAQEQEADPITDIKTDTEAGDNFPLLPSDMDSKATYKTHQGLASTLALLMQRGAVEEAKPKATDRRPEETGSGNNAPSAQSSRGHRHGVSGVEVPKYYREVEIERKDQFGRAMNEKAAFKAFSAEFSGRQSGKRKQEKKYQKFKDQMQQMRDSTETAVAASLNSLQTAQRKAAAPFVVLDAQKILARGTGTHDAELGETLKQPASASGKASMAPGGASTRR